MKKLLSSVIALVAVTTAVIGAGFAKAADTDLIWLRQYEQSRYREVSWSASTGQVQVISDGK